tara:strand:- start:443 stop:901 length:459 start_codon:yes stop_codon:yes gene_type:complete
LVDEIPAIVKETATVITLYGRRVGRGLALNFSLYTFQGVTIKKDRDALLGLSWSISLVEAKEVVPAIAMEGILNDWSAEDKLDLLTGHSRFQLLNERLGDWITLLDVHLVGQSAPIQEKYKGKQCSVQSDHQLILSFQPLVSLSEDDNQKKS